MFAVYLFEEFSSAWLPLCCLFQDWAEDIMAIARNPLTYNAPRYTFLEKM